MESVHQFHMDQECKLKNQFLCKVLAASEFPCGIERNCHFMGRVVRKFKIARNWFNPMHLVIFSAKMFALAISRGNDSNKNYSCNENHLTVNAYFSFQANS